MIVTIIFIAILLFFAGLFNGRMDYIKLHQLDSESWEKKWEWEPLAQNGFKRQSDRVRYKQVGKPWYYFGLHKPEYKEAFPYSSTILVFLTDEWHLKKWLMFLCIELIIVAIFTQYNHLHWLCIPVGIIVLKTLRGLGFTLIYDRK